MGYFLNLDALTIRQKGVQDMATEADINTEKLIRERMYSRYPDDVFFGEETGSEYQPQTDQGVWVVDPIDGTHPFISGMPYWCVSIAYLINGQVEMGVIYDPNRDELFSAGLKGGAYLNDTPIHVSASKTISDGLTGIGFSTRIEPEDILRPLERLIRARGVYHRNGSGALSIAYVACGRLIGFFEPHMNAWDCLAGILLVKEAGGLSDDFLDDNNSLVKGNRVIVAADGTYEELKTLVCG